MEGKPDDWQTHVCLEILDAATDKPRLLEITTHLHTMLGADLIPDDTADVLFTQIEIANHFGRDDK